MLNCWVTLIFETYSSSRPPHTYRRSSSLHRFSFHAFNTRHATNARQCSFSQLQKQQDLTPRVILMSFPVSRRVGGWGDLEPWEISDPFFLSLVALLCKFCILLRNGQGVNICSDRSFVKYLIYEVTHFRLNSGPV